MQAISNQPTASNFSNPAFRPRFGYLYPMMIGIAPIRAAICCEDVIVISFGHNSIAYEWTQRSQPLANLRLKDRDALSCLAATGDDLFPAVLLDRQGFAGENILVAIVPSRAPRMGSMDDSVPGSGMAGGALPVRPRAAILGPVSPLAGVFARGDCVPRNFDPSHATF